MNQSIMEKVDELAAQDVLYQHMLQDGKLLEERVDTMVRGLSDEKRAIASEFVMHCEDMSIRKLELACSLISQQASKRNETPVGEGH